MKITKQARRDAKQLFHSCQVNGLLDESRVRQVVQRGHRARSRAVTSRFCRTSSGW